MARFWSKSLPFTNRPTAQALLAEVAATLPNAPPVPGCGLVTCAHFWPFQCRIKGWPTVPLEKSPTAQASVADTVRTPRSPARVPGLGLVTCCQVWPSQCRIRVCSTPGAALVPTAQTSAADTARTPLRTLPSPATSGLGTTVQAEPSQCSVSVWLRPLLPVS